MADKCENCVYFKQTKNTEHNSAYKAGECRRNPPVGFFVSEQNGHHSFQPPVYGRHFPYVKPDDYCGEFVATLNE